MTNTLFTIITPCLNSEKTIEKTVLSVLNQSYTNIQYIIIDGQSTDKTLEILYKYQKNDSRLVIISQKDNSMTEALNRGLKLAKGKIIASINADDWYELDAVENVVHIYHKKSFDCLISNTRIVSDLGKTLYINRPWTAPWLIAWYLMGCLTPECSVFYSADCIRDIGYFNEDFKYTQDLEYYLRILKKHKMSYTNQLLSNFFVSSNQASFRVGNQMKSEVLSYIDYKILRRFIGGTSLGSLIKMMLGVRIYSFKELYNHLFQYLTIRGYL